MSEMAKTYTPAEIEGEIKSLWIKSNAFKALPDERPRDKRYVIMMPLPNVTGALHMGHAMDNVMQDLLIRWHRMKGDNTLWMPGTDHAGIATQAVVEKRLKELEGLTRHDVGREGLVTRIWQWKDQYQARIVAQQQRMGCSCDWDRARFTMDKVCARAVRHAFFKMFSDSLIFRGKRLVNWDPFLRTTISDDEMYYETVAGHFWHLLYPVINPRKGEPTHVCVATTRPETMLGDTAVAVHPDPAKALDERIAEVKKQAAESKDAAAEELLTQLVERKKTLLPALIQLRDMALDNRKIMLPLLEREIPLITDIWAKPDLGSGCVKITPAHDHNDYAVWTRHRDKIDIINILNPDGTLNEAAGDYKGIDRFAARKKVVEDLQAKNLLKEIEDREIEIGHSDRSKSPVEPFLSDQWFVRMGDIKKGPDDKAGITMGRGTPKEFTSPGLVQAAMDAVTTGRVKIHPERYTKTYLDWLSEKRDWPISRQLWWGHRIPVWSKEVAAVDLSKEKIFAELAVGIAAGIAAALKKKQAVHELCWISIFNPQTEERRSVAGSSLPDVQVPAANETIRIDICLLEDDPNLMKILEQAGFSQDPDVLDTWFSSSLWPFSTLGWPDPQTAPVEIGQTPLDNCLDYYYPGSCLVTARDIITLWVARMVLAGLYNLGDVPFTDVFIHANILDGKGVRMSKSKGNGIDPVDIIEAYGTDAMRYVLADMQTGTQDIRLPVTAVCPSCGLHNDLGNTVHGSTIFCYVCGKHIDGSKDKAACGKEFDVLGTLPDLPQAKLISERFEIGRSFATKLWNSARFAFMNLEKKQPLSGELLLEDRWILSELSRTIRETTKGLTDYNPSYSINAIREFFWGSFCDWYLEAIKPRTRENGKAGGEAQAVLAFVLDQVLRLLHPFIPFITEYLWQRLCELIPDRQTKHFACTASDTLIKAAWPQEHPASEKDTAIALFPAMQAVIRAIREVRAERKLPPREEMSVTLKTDKTQTNLFTASADLVKTLAVCSAVAVDADACRKKGDAVRISGEITIFIHNVIDEEKEKSRLVTEKERLLKEIEICAKKLSNPDFTDKAPAQVVTTQRDKVADFRTQLHTVEENLRTLEKN